MDSVPPQSPFHYPVYRNMWVASLLSNFGNLIQVVGAAWLMTSLGGSAEQVTLVQAATTLPILLLALFAGALADNFDRRKVMLAAQCLMFAVSLLLATLSFADWLSPPVLLIFTFAVACGTAINGPAWQTSVGDMVPRDMLPQAVALNGLGFNIARSVGPAIGGVIVAVVGGAAAFVTNAICSVGLILVLARPGKPWLSQSMQREKLGVAMAAGIRYVAMSPHLKVVLGRAAIFGIGSSAIPALLPLVARDLIGGTAITYGLLLGAFGMGAIMGAVCLRRLRIRLSTERIIALASLAVATGAGVASVSPTMVLTLPAMALAGIGWVLALATFNLTVQLSSPRWVVARAIALYQMAAYGGMAGGSWFFGWIAHRLGLREALLAAVAILLGSAMAGLAWPVADIGDGNLDPADRWKEPDTGLLVTMRSGPIAIEIEHQVDKPNIPAFLVAMSERKRIRRRDGASNWRLFRDLNAQHLWVEKYEFATWLDYVRHARRGTIADQENADEIARLRMPGAPPLVRRLIERQAMSQPVRVSDIMADPTRAS
jgi:MFS family permease